MGVHLISFKITDAGGKSKSAVFTCSDTATYAQVAAFVAQIDSLLDATISGIIDSAQVTMALPTDPLLNATPADDMLVEDGGLLSFSAAGTAYRHGIYIPTYSLTLIGNDKGIDNAGATAALVTALLSGTNVTVTDKYENALASFLSGSRVHRK